MCKYVQVCDRVSLFIGVCLMCACEPSSPHLGLPVYATPAATVLVETGDRSRREEPPLPLLQQLPIIDGESTGPRRDRTHTHAHRQMDIQRRETDERTSGKTTKGKQNHSFPCKGHNCY